MLYNLRKEETVFESANCKRRRQARKRRWYSEWKQHFVPLLRPFYRPMCLAGLAVVLDAMLTILRPWPLKIIIDRVVSHRHARVPFLGGWLDSAPFTQTQILIGACIATVLIAVITGLLTYYYMRTMGEIGQHFVLAARRKLFAHLQRLSLRFHDRQRTGDLITYLTADVRAAEDIISGSSIALISNSCLLFGMLVLMFWLDWKFALAALSVAPLLFWSVLYNRDRLKNAVREARVSDGQLAALAQETLASIRMVQSLAQEEQQDERFHTQNETSLNAYLDSVKYQARVAPLADVLAAVGLAIVMWYGATRVLAGELSTGDVIVFFAYVTSLYGPLRALARISYSLQKASIAVERMSEVLDVQREVTDHEDVRMAPRLQGRIEFRDVSFAYGADVPVLSHISLSIAPGEKIAIVGTTGAGKSTLISLLPRLYDPIEGAILIDGEDIRNYQLQSLREQISLVLQDSLLFSGTIRENIAFGRPAAGEAEIISAAKTANAHGFIERLPHEYDTQVSEGGMSLSGGQKQRVAIARAILRDAPILILDEPTSGLDAASERIVIDALERAIVGRTTLIIAHRLTTVRFADRIVVLEEGRIVEQGTPAQLLAQNGRYAELYRHQFGAGGSPPCPPAAISRGIERHCVNSGG